MRFLEDKVGDFQSSLQCHHIFTKCVYAQHWPAFFSSEFITSCIPLDKLGELIEDLGHKNCSIIAGGN